MRRMSAAAGTSLFFTLAPSVVAGVIPWLLTRWEVRDRYWLPVRLLGALMIAAGVLVLIHSFARFVSEGVGTPAPVAPTERLVVGGLYRYVRNPMYLAVLAAIVGQALLIGRPVLLVYGAAVAGAFVASFASTKSGRSQSATGRSTRSIAAQSRAGDRVCAPGPARDLTEATGHVKLGSGSFT